LIDQESVQSALKRESPAWRFAHMLARRVPLNHALWRASEAAVLSQVRMERPILDIGCGDGIFAKMLFEQPVEVGIDLSASHLTKARESGAYLDLRVADATELPFPDESFATVFSNCVLEHIPDVDEVCREVARVLRPGGQFVFTVPTEHFGEFLFFPTVFRAVGLPGLAERYTAGLNHVFAHYHTQPLRRWSRRLDHAGLELVAAWEIMPRPLQAVWDILMPFSAFQLFVRKLFPNWPYPIQRLMLDAARDAFEDLLRPTGRPGANRAVVARKPLRLR
jgi:SAM-dependent methyltransferase